MVWSWRFSRRQCVIYTTQRRRFVYDTWDDGSRLDRVMVEGTLSITHCLRLNLQLHTIDLVRICRIGLSSFCTVAWQLARFQLTRRIAQSLGDSWASCYIRWPIVNLWLMIIFGYMALFRQAVFRQALFRQALFRQALPLGIIHCVSKKARHQTLAHNFPKC